MHKLDSRGEIQECLRAGKQKKWKWCLLDWKKILLWLHSIPPFPWNKVQIEFCLQWRWKRKRCYSAGSFGIVVGSGGDVGWCWSILDGSAPANIFLINISLVFWTISFAMMMYRDLWCSLRCLRKARVAICFLIFLKFELQYYCIWYSHPVFCSVPV